MFNYFRRNGGEEWVCGLHNQVQAESCNIATSQLVFLSATNRHSLAVVFEFCYKYVDINKRHCGVASSIDRYRKEKIYERLKWKTILMKHISNRNDKYLVSLSILSHFFKQKIYIIQFNSPYESGHIIESLLFLFSQSFQIDFRPSEQHMT